MAHRLLVRRIWTASVRDVRCPRAPSSALYSTLLCSSASPQTLLSPWRSLPHALPVTARREVSFNVQDQEDFTERVINSELPVVVDFHAQLRIIFPLPFPVTLPCSCHCADVMTQLFAGGHTQSQMVKCHSCYCTMHTIHVRLVLRPGFPDCI